MVRKLDIILSLISGIIIGGISFLQSDPLSTMLSKLIPVLIIFYFLGFIVKYMIKRIYSDSQSNTNKVDGTEPNKEDLYEEVKTK